MSQRRSRRSRNVLPAIIAAPIALAGMSIAGLAQLSPAATDSKTYWRLPLAAQGEPPANWTDLERSLAPADCGRCHADQFDQWRSSRHAHAFSPGLAGQLLASEPDDAPGCLRCHAPLAEQRLAFEATRDRGAANVDASLAGGGDSCGGCHLRGYRHFGPPQRGTGATGASRLAAPHGGVLRTAWFESAEFCGACHQFPASEAVNGKPLENTLAEWQASPQAAQKIVCQACHMPERRHVWRGIHDPQMVASGLTPRITANADGVRFAITNTGIGHAFPTYVTPKVLMFAVALDGAGSPRAETLRSHVIARDVRWQDDRWIELSDSRLLPGETTAIEAPWQGSERIRVWLEVRPDDVYRNDIYPALLNALPANGEARELIVKALADAGTSRFRLFETELREP
jgi:hypothetical protein